MLEPDNYDEELHTKRAKAWNSRKYTKELGNIEQVLYDVAARNKEFPAIIGVSEIENRNVLEDIVILPKLERANYRICHYDSPDARGVDVALLYRPDIFKLEDSRAVPVKMEDNPDWRTRDILTTWGTIDGEEFCFIVCHWPSRLGGQAASEPKRLLASSVVRGVIDSMSTARPNMKFVVMGDMNDDPTDKSMFETLRAKGRVKDMKEGDLFNPYLTMLKAGYGTLAYGDSWNIFDNIIVSQNLINGGGGAQLMQSNGKYYGHIFDAKYLFQKDGQYKGYPMRTYIGNNFQNGYSDHLPVYILIGK